MIAAAPGGRSTIRYWFAIEFQSIKTMDRPTAAQQACAAYAEVVGAASTRLKVANNKIADSWAKHKPTTVIGWTVRL
jgi:hypothetical protein